MRTRPIIILIFFLPFFNLKAQHTNTSIMVGAGPAIIMGDPDLSPFDLYSYGYTIAARYIVPMSNERWNFTIEVNNTSINQKGWSNLEYYSAQVSQAFMGVGVRFYVTKTIERYNPWLGEFLPFIEVNAGMVRNNITHNAPFGQVDANSGLIIDTKNRLAPNIQIVPGFLVVLDRTWAIEAFGGIRYNPKDNWDGVVGSTGLGDIYLHGGLGLNYAF